MRITFHQIRTIASIFLTLFVLTACLTKETTDANFNGTQDSPPAGDSGGGATNSAPTISGSPQSVVVEGSTYNFTPSAVDADGDELTFSIQNQPQWATFDSSNGNLTGAPTIDDLGTVASIQISVSDGQSQARLPSFSIEVLERREAGVYYAAPLSTSCNPDNPGSGTFEDPWVNPYFALVRGGLRPGDTLQLRGGTYQNLYRGFMSDNSDDDRLTACDDDQRSSGGDGTHTVIPLFLAGEPGNEIIIENFPGETVVIDGTNARLASTWEACGNGAYRTRNINVGSARTPQVWVDPTGPEDPGTRLRWRGGGSCTLEQGEFSADTSGTVYVRLPNDADPSTRDVHMTCQGGDCATHPIHATTGAQYITVRKNPQGGSFYVKYGYYIGYITGGASNLTFDGLNWIAGGGRDYGYCVRVHNGSNVTFKNGICRETMGEGMGLYGGMPDVGIQISGVVVENMEVFDTGRGWVDGGGSGSSLGMGIILKNCNNCVVRDSVIHNSYRGGIQVNFSTDGCPSATCQSNNIILERNEIYDFCRERQNDDPFAGKTDCGAITIRHNGRNGQIDGPIVRNNMIHGTYGVPLSNNASPSGIYTDGDVSNASIINNSLYSIPGACINVAPNPNQVQILGNAMNNCSTGRGGCNGQVCALYASSSVRPESRYNTYWAATGDTQVVRLTSGSGYTRDNALSWESAAVQADPQFSSSNDLRIPPTSGLVDVMPCDDAASEDYMEMPRPQGSACDVGAFEQ